MTVPEDILGGLLVYDIPGTAGMSLEKLRVRLIACGLEAITPPQRTVADAVRLAVHTIRKDIGKVGEPEKAGPGWWRWELTARDTGEHGIIDVINDQLKVYSEHGQVCDIVRDIIEETHNWATHINLRKVITSAVNDVLHVWLGETSAYLTPVSMQNIRTCLVPLLREAGAHAMVLSIEDTPENRAELVPAVSAAINDMYGKLHTDIMTKYEGPVESVYRGDIERWANDLANIHLLSYCLDRMGIEPPYTQALVKMKEEMEKWIKTKPDRRKRK